MRKVHLLQRHIVPIFAALALLPVSARSQSHPESHAAASPTTAPMHAIATLHPTEGNSCHGTVRFDQDGGAVKVTVDLAGLPPGKHAIHVHEFGDCSSPDGMSAGGHYNPESFPHAMPPTPQRHAGDLGNLEADAKGNAHYELTVDNITVAGTKNPVLGHAVIVHEKLDDGGQPVGNAGGRLACGVIGLAKPAAMTK